MSNTSIITKITGNTYPVKDALKAIGCRWDAQDKCWTASTDEMAAKAQAIMSGTPAAKSAPTCSPAQSRRGVRGQCWECGRTAFLNRDGECGQC